MRPNDISGLSTQIAALSAEQRRDKETVGRFGKTTRIACGVAVGAQAAAIGGLLYVAKFGAGASPRTIAALVAMNVAAYGAAAAVVVLGRAQRNSAGAERRMTSRHKRMQAIGRRLLARPLGNA